MRCVASDVRCANSSTTRCRSCSPVTSDAGVCKRIAPTETQLCVDARECTRMHAVRSL
jgi:hypothetical protein